MQRFQLPLRPRRELQDDYDQRVVVLEKALHELQRRIRRTVEAQGLRPTMKYRIKSFDSFYEKLLRRSRDGGAGQTVEITDLMGIRVVCPFVEDIGRAEQALISVLDITEVERKGAELATTEFGYASVHLLTRLPGDICDSFHLNQEWICEVQLRTILQDAWAEVEHELVYKAELTPLDGGLRRKLAALNANLTLSDIIFQEIRDYQHALQHKLMRRREEFWVRAMDGAQQVDGFAAPKADRRPADQGRVPRPEQLADEPIETGSDTIDSMLIKALNAHNQRDYDGATRMYTDILAYQPRGAVAALIHSHRGMARFALGNAEAALEDFSETIRLSPETARAFYYRGIVLRHLGRLDEALEDFSRCLEQDPVHLESLVARARVHLQLGSPEAAAADLSEVDRLDPAHPDLSSLRDELPAAFPG